MSKHRNIIQKCLLLSTPNLTVESSIRRNIIGRGAEGLFTAIRRIFGPQKFLAIRYIGIYRENEVLFANPRIKIHDYRSL